MRAEKVRTELNRAVKMSDENSFVKLKKKKEKDCRCLRLREETVSEEVRRNAWKWSEEKKG